MSYVFIIFVILLVTSVLIFLNITVSKKDISYDNDWIMLVQNRIIESDKHYLFRENADLIIDNKKKLNFVMAKNRNMAVYSNRGYLNKFMLVFSACSSVKVTFMEGYVVENNRLYYTYSYKSSYYQKLHKWMEINGVFESKEVWIANKNAKWDTFPSPKYNDINWEKKAPIGDFS